MTTPTKFDPREEFVAKKPDPGLFFLDSGAHSLYTKYVIKAKHKDGYAYYDTQEFWDYVDSYAMFVKEHIASIDYYANVDVIFDPERSWKVQKYLEKKHKLNPIPVLHYGTPIEWIKKHLDAGYEFLGIGGLGQEATAGLYQAWADELFALLCPRPRRMPVVRTHGFAMTSYDLLIRYPWWSVDSASWAKSAAYGSIYVPHRREGNFVFTESPYVVVCSDRSESAKVRNGVFGKHIYTYPKNVQKIVHQWLEYIDVPLGKMTSKGEVKEPGVINHYGSRGVANMRFFQRMCDSLPTWPWPFKVDTKKAPGFFSRLERA